MKKRTAIVLILVLTLMLPTVAFAATTHASTSTQVDRLWGYTKYDTATVIADRVAQKLNIDFASGQQFQNVVIASGNNYPDALAGVPLASILKAPILPVDITPEGSATTLNYIQAHVNKAGDVYILGGTAVIPSSFTSYLESLGFDVSHIHRIGGYDAGETSLLIAQQISLMAEQSKGKIYATELVSDANFYDALTIAPAAAIDGGPILLVSQEGLTSAQKAFCDQIPAVLSFGEVTKSLSRTYPRAISISGTNRYDSNEVWNKYYLDQSTETVYLATGENFPDALAGGILAGYTRGPIILTSHNSLQPETVRALNEFAYYAKLPHINEITRKTIPPINYPQLVVFGGTGAISDDVVKQAQQILNGPGYPTSGKVNTMGNSAGNIVNNGLATIQGEWIYYTDHNYGGALYKVKTDGTGIVKLTDDDPSYINVSGDWIYYSSVKDNKLYKIKVDGTEWTKLNDDWSEITTVVGEWIYYVNGSDNFTIYKMKTDGTNKVKLNSDASTDINVIGNSIYYLGVDDNFKIYRINTDGSGKSKVNDLASAYNMIVDGENIYYSNLTDTNRFAIFTMKIDGTSIRKLTDDHSKSFSIDHDWIYYCNYSDGYYLYKIKKDGTNKTKLNNNVSSYINVIGDWVYYVKNPPSDSQLYKTKIDGSEDKPVE